MHDSVDLFVAQYPRHEITVSDASPYERSPANGPFIPGAQVVNDGWNMTCARKGLAGMASDISSAADDKNAQGSILTLQWQKAADYDPLPE
jgi:hypothetical protein